MNLKDALKELKNGKSMCRKEWTLESGYLSLLTGMDHIWKIVLTPTPNAGNYIFPLKDLLATDWQEFALPVEAEADIND